MILIPEEAGITKKHIMSKQYPVFNKLSLLIIFFLISIQVVSALTAESSNYSTSLFKAGIATSNPSSIEYKATTLATAESGTRNAQSDNITTNIGSFNNTVPYPSVNTTASQSESDNSQNNSGGGSSSQVCNYLWECSEWSVCINGEQTRICLDKGSCDGQVGKPIETQICEESPLNVILNLKNLEITEANQIRINVELTQTRNAEKVDVQILYTIYSENSKELFKQTETRTIETGIIYNKVFNEIKLIEGNYKFRIDILYGNNQKTYADEDFTIKQDFIAQKSENTLNNKRALSNTIRNITLVMIIAMITSLMIARIYSREYQEKRNNRLTSTTGKKVYTENGYKLGKIGEVYLNGSQIYGWLINLDSKISRKHQHKKIIIKQKDVVSIKDVLLIKGDLESILEQLKK